jgi:radical SAM superfamily enzyme YgiQ (UPF0313 family)
MHDRTALLINPPVYDFAAYDFWLKPLGLLRVGGMLQEAGFRVRLLDYLDRNHPRLPEGKHRRSDEFGRGHYFRTEVPLPPVLRDIPRKFKRYGLPEDTAEEILESIDEPEVILIQTMMTYWYPGVAEVVEAYRRRFQRSKIVLGGTYASLQPDHARKVTGADLLIFGSNLSPLWDLLGIEAPTSGLPVWDLYPSLDYAVTTFTEGCPFHCTYCAGPALMGSYRERPVEAIVEELKQLQGLGVIDVALYDDALLFRSKEFFFPLMERLGSEDLRFQFHTPNGLSARALDDEAARCLRDSGFATIHIGFETSDPERQRSTGGKVTSEELERALESLERAGYARKDVVVYLLMGLPEQPPDEVEESIRYVNQIGAHIMLAEFSPVPGTVDGQRARELAPLDDPLQENSTVFPLLYYGQRTVNRLKRLAKESNQALSSEK